MDDPTPNDPLIPLRLTTLLKILWGYRDSADRRDKCVPPADVATQLRAIDPTIASLHYHIQGDGEHPFIWHIDEWRRSGANEARLKADSDKFNYSKDKLNDWLTANVSRFPVFKDVGFRTAIVNQAVSSGNLELFKVFGLTDAELTMMKEGKYER